MKRIITIIALAAAAAAAPAQTVQLSEFKLTPLPDTRGGNMGNIHMVWRVIGPTGTHWEFTILTTGCDKGHGAVSFHPNTWGGDVDLWTAKGTGVIDDIARTMCKWQS